MLVFQSISKAVLSLVMMVGVETRWSSLNFFIPMFLSVTQYQNSLISKNM